MALLPALRGGLRSGRGRWACAARRRLRHAELAQCRPHARGKPPDRVDRGRRGGDRVPQPRPRAAHSALNKSLASGPRRAYAGSVLMDRSAERKGLAPGTGMALVGIAAAVFVVCNDFTAPAVALPTIEKDFNTDIGSVQWVINAYALVF